MKRIIKNLLVICLVVAITASYMAPVAAYADQKTQSTTNYTDIFDQAMVSDGADSERIAIELADAYSNDAAGLISAMNERNSVEIETIAKLLAYGYLYEDFESFEASVNQQMRLATANTPALNAIIDAVATLKAAQNAQASSNTSPLEDNAPFDPERIRYFIETHNYEDGADESFFTLLANAYCASPELFADTISSMDESIINYVSKAVAYDIIKNERTVETAVTANNSIISMVENAIADTSNGNLETFASEDEIAAASASIDTQAARSALTIGNMDYTSAPLYVGSTETLSVVYSNSDTGSSRTYLTKVYQVQNGVEKLKASRTITIPPGVSSITQSYSMNFYDVGPIYTLVKVYTQNGSTLVNSRQGKYPDTVRGEWSIRITFTSDRSQLGTMKLYNAAGTTQMSVSCLGKSAYGYNMYTTNGDTPTGEYTGYLYGPASPTSSYGPYKVVAMTGISGVIKTSGRSGIWIHGGDSASSGSSTYPLRPTYGCVRITNAHQNTMVTKITSLTSSTGYHDTTGKISIVEQ